MNTKNNNQIYFEQLFQEYSDVIYRLALYKTNDIDTAEEITQETFLRLWKHIESDKEIDNPKSYLYQITRNLVIDYYRKKKDTSLDNLIEEGFEPSNQTTKQETLTDIHLLRSVIDNLDEMYREPIYLKYIEGYKVKEIARIMEVSENVVSVRISRGKQQLQERFST